MATTQDSYAQQKTDLVLSTLDQRLVTLSSTSKTALLSEATQVVYRDESQARAATIVTRLKNLNPELAQQFHPKQDALSKLNLRMISSRPQSKNDSAASFIAVSYCWHSDRWALAPAATPISVGWEISEPMMNAVMELRETPEEGVRVWLDKLCINQNDQADIMTHLGVMDTIYRSARRVAILLEDVQLKKDEEKAGLAFEGFYKDLLQNVMNLSLDGEEKGRFVDQYFPRRSNELNADTLAAARPFVMKMLGARWYSRAWCAHESRMMKHQKINNPLLLCFDSEGQVLSFEFRFIHYLGYYLRQSEPPEPIAPSRFQESFNNPNPTSLHQLWWRANRLMPDANPNVTPMQHLVNVLSADCFKKGDLMSIALNTAGIPLYYAGEDIQSVEEVVWKFTNLVLAAGDLSPLLTIGKKLRIPTTTGGSIISWAIDPDRGVLDDEVANPLPCSITAITREYIELDLLVFESTPKEGSPESKAKATRLIAEYGLDVIGDQQLLSLDEAVQSLISQVAFEMERTRSNPPRLQTLRHLLLSLALDNGLDWFLAFPGAMHQATASSWFQGTVGEYSNPALTPAANVLLALFNTNANTTNTTTTNSIPTPPTPSQTHAATLALTTLLDPRLLLLTPNPRRLPPPPHPSISSTSNTDLTTALLTPATSNRAYLAIPTALAHLPAWHRRAWVLEPFDPVIDRPETVAELLPSVDLGVALAGEDVGVEIDDVVPVLSSDYKDRRRGLVGEEGSRGWRLRSREVVFGGCGGLWRAEGKEMMERGDERLRGGEGVVLLRRQRVYGAEDYPWAEIHEALRKAFGDGVDAVNDVAS